MTTYETPSLFDAPIQSGAHRKRDPRSSVLAARAVDAQRQRDQIVRLLTANPQGMTADELAAQMRPSPHRSSVAARLAQLGPGVNGDNVVYPFGVRANAGGRSVQIWHLKWQPREITVRVSDSRL